MRALDRKANSFGLFADHVRAEQPTPEQRIAHMQARSDDLEADLRAIQAKHWRDGRRILASLPPEERALLVHAWNASGCPRDGTYFVSFVKSKRKETHGCPG
jgi:hypothetical protein